MDEERINRLADKWLKNTINEEELRELEAWFAENDEESLSISSDASEHELGQRLYNRIDQRLHPKPVKRLWKRIAVAASILIALATSTLFLLQQRSRHTTLTTAQIVHTDILPGSNKATLTLSNGQQISLNQLKAGQIASQEKTIITKTADGKVVYTAGNRSGGMVYNTVTTPRGGEWPALVLPDGTKVRLDAASSIRYPVAFSGKERLVEVTGQVYFEVVHRADQPFRVKAGDQVIEDIGTVFNINAYGDEPGVKTTLVSGAVRVVKDSKSVLMKPGQQAMTTKSNENISVQNVNISDELAWLSGQIALKGQSLEEVIRQASRWYDLDIYYKGQAPKRPLAGTLSRKVKLDDLLKALAFYNIHFSLQGKTLTVTDRL